MLSLKTFLLRYHLLLALFVFAILALMVSAMQGFRSEYLLTGSIGIALFVYFVQKQKLEELKIFKKLFKEFNDRYEMLNGDLNRIISAGGNKSIAKADKNILDDYFNLCSEEYFYYTEGVIPPQVWKAWRNGMKAVFGNEKVRKIWDDEKKADAYYGFEEVVDRMKVIREG